MPAPIKTIKGFWDKYKEINVPANASEEQIADTQRAFYAGFMVMFEINHVIGHPTFHEVRAVNWLTELHQEIARYLRYEKEQFEAKKANAEKPN